MKPADLADWFALRRHLQRPWAFVRLRHRTSATPHVDLPLRGGGAFRLRVAEHDRHVFKRVFARDDYRLDGLAPGSLGVVVDVGAHIGAFAVRAAGLARRLLCFEPDPANFEVLSRNIAGRPHVAAFRQAVADGRGTLPLNLGVNGSRNSLVYPDGTRGTIPVETLGLADLFAEHGVERCDLLKIDVEGAEYRIVRAAPPELWTRVDRLRLEYHPVPGESGEELERRLGGLGYRVERAPHPKNAGEGLLFAERR